MTLLPVAQVYWKRLGKTDADALLDKSGAKHIPVRHEHNLRQVAGNPTMYMSGHQGNKPTYDVNIRGPAGSIQTVMLQDDVRGGGRSEWLIRQQNMPNTHPAWQPGTKLPADVQSIIGHYLFLVRTGDDAVHARIGTEDEVQRMPVPIRSKITPAKNQDVITLSESAVSDARVPRIMDALREHHNVLLYGPPGTSKTYLMALVRDAFLHPANSVTLDEDAADDFFGETASVHHRACPQSWWVTFHQSLGYEDFVVGLRTVPGETFQLEPVPGPLLEAAEHARLSDGASLLLIDEVNRGNAGRIFGEFITVMESGKRLSADNARQPETVDLRLPSIGAEGLTFELTRPCDDAPRDVEVGAPFQMPWHVYTLASMNSVDRSVSPLDAAMRRRFHVIELEPDYGLVVDHLGLTGSPDEWGTLESTTDDHYWLKLAIRALEQTNARLRMLVGRDFELGQAYMLDLADREGPSDIQHGIIEIWTHRVLPQLRELFVNDERGLGAVLRVDAAQPAGYPFQHAEVPIGLENEGADAQIEIRELTTANVELMLRRLGGLADDSDAP